MNLLVKLLVISIVAVALAACGSDEIAPLPTAPSDAAPIEVDGIKMTNGLFVTSRFTCDGRNLSPEISWSGVPSDAVSVVMVLDDPDAPGGTFIHWLVFNIPTDVTSFGEGEGGPFARLTSGGSQAFNSFDGLGYSGPCPPQGETHRYLIHVYALSSEITTEPQTRITRDDVFPAMDGLIIGYGVFESPYVRQEFGERNVVFD